jgi:hypothetical protein
MVMTLLLKHEYLSLNELDLNEVGDCFFFKKKTVKNNSVTTQKKSLYFHPRMHNLSFH